MERRFRACASLLGVLSYALLFSAGPGCSSAKDEPAPAGTGGSAQGGGGGSTQGGGGAAGTGPSVGGAAGADSGSTAMCSTKPAADPSPDLTGRWAWKTVASRLMPKTGLTPEFHTRTVSILLGDHTQTGSIVGVDMQYCDQYAEEDPNAPTHVAIPDKYKASLARFQRTGTYASQADGGVAVLDLPTFTEVEGAHLADPVNGVLPTVPTDLQVFDQDADGNPGVTIKIGGLISGSLYVVQRQKSALSGIATGKDRVEGHYEFASEQIILDSDSPILKATAGSQQAMTDPNTCASAFTMVRMPAVTTCADVLADAATLFQ
jgi:hypothetical protein